VRPAVRVLLLLGAAAPPLAAQRFVFGLAGVGGDYREATNDLRDVSGLAGTALLTLGRFTAEATVSGLAYEPDEAAPRPSGSRRRSSTATCATAWCGGPASSWA
jgi:hypothetical protein